MGNKLVNGWPICNVCGEIIASWSESGQGHHDRCRRSLIPAGNIIVGGNNEGEVVDDIALIEGTTVEIIPEAGCVAYVDDTKPGGVAIRLSDETKARLAHLEAIEAATRKMDSFREGPDSLILQITCHRDAETALHELIREGMKDNG